MHKNNSKGTETTRECFDDPLKSLCRMKLFSGNADKTIKVACASWPLCTTIFMHMYNN